MQFSNIIAALFLLIANISFASAYDRDDVVYLTMTTSVEVTSTVYVDTITLTGHPSTTQDPSMPTIYPNNTLVDPTGTVPLNTTTPTPSTPMKDSSGSATFSGSLRAAAAAGAIAVVLGMI